MLGKSLVYTALFSICLVGCGRDRPRLITAEDHRLAFFPKLNGQEISEYLFVYRSERGGYATVAKFITSNTNSLMAIPEGFVEKPYIDQPSDRRAMADLIRFSAASLLGGTNGVPAWFKPPVNSFYRYYLKREASLEWSIWLASGENGIYLYLVGSGDGDIIPRRTKKN